MLQRFLPKEEDLKLAQAQELLAAGNAAEALPLLKDAWQSSQQRSDIGLTLAETQIALSRSEDAEAVLATIPLQDRDTRYQGLVAQIELLKQAADTPKSNSCNSRYSSSRTTSSWQCSWRCSCIRSGVTKKRWNC